MGRGERDLLIKLETKLDSVIIDLKEMKDNNAARLTAVEVAKLDRTEYNRLQAEQLGVNVDHESRLRNVERYLFLGLGSFAVITFLLNYFHPFG